MSEPFKPAALLLHGSAASIMAFGWFGLQTLAVSELIETQKGGHFQFLTIQGLAVAWLTMTLSLISDVMPFLPVVRRVKRVVFMIAMPLAVVVSSIYWSLLLLAPSLILRPEQSSSAEPSSSPAAPAFVRIPLNLDLALHAAPAVSLVLDFFLFEQKYTKKQARYGGFIVVAGAGVGYASWVEYLATHNGIFPYPFLTMNPFEIRAIIYAIATTFAYVCFLLLNALRT